MQVFGLFESLFLLVLTVREVREVDDIHHLGKEALSAIRSIVTDEREVRDGYHSDNAFIFYCMEIPQSQSTKYRGAMSE